MTAPSSLYYGVLLFYLWFLRLRDIFRRNKNALVSRWFFQLTENPALDQVIDSALADV